MLNIRPEKSEDISAIYTVDCEAFSQTEEAELVSKLRTRGVSLISLVAEQDDKMVGHILLSPVSVESFKPKGMGLGPLAVLPGYQRQGIGAKLVEEGLQNCCQAGYDFVVVLGYPHYYPRFGFRPASQFGLKCEFPAPDEAFMALELKAGVLSGASGTVHYLPEFGGV